MKKILFFVMMTVASPVFAANVTGTINFSGVAPTPTEINMGADPTCAQQNAGALNEDVIVNSNQTLKNVFVYIKEGLEGRTFETPKEPAVLDQVGCLYTPRVLGVQVGQTLQILNSDPTLHNVHGMPTKGKEFNLGMPIKGMKLKRKFDKPEVMVKTKCDVHPWMAAYIGVLEHPFFGTSGDTGTFEIKNLPPGTYTLEAWHEKFGTKTQSITVEAEGTATADFEFTA